MTTEKQLIANRVNAGMSTGPRTEAGKAKSQGSALKHGLTAKQVVMPGEDPAVYTAFQERLLTEIAPQTMLEEELADRLVSTLWRLRRVPLLENALFAWLQHQRSHKDRGPFGSEYVDFVPPPGVTTDAANDYIVQSWPGRKEPDSRVMKLMGRTLEDVLSDKNFLTKLSGYEARLWRQAERIWAQLQELRAARGPDDEPVGEIH